MALAASPALSELEVSTRVLPQTRRRRRRRTKALSNARLLLLCVVPLTVMILYVALTAGLTAQTYTLGVQQRLHTKLVEKNNELRSRVAELQSVERLQAAARQLHMGEPAKVAVIAFPVAIQPAERRTALLDRIAGVARWLNVR